MEPGAAGVDSSRDAHSRPAGTLRPEVPFVGERLSSPLVVVTQLGRIRYANGAADRLIGAGPGALDGRDVLALVHSADRARARRGLEQAARALALGGPVELRMRSAGRSWKHVLVVASSLHDDGSATGDVLVNVTDVSELRAQERSGRELALRDPTTGMANRRALNEHLSARVPAGAPVAAAFIDLDRFKQVNECLGHTVGDTVGDTVLQAVAARLGAELGKGNDLFHFGADTFVVVFGSASAGRSVELCWELVARLANPLFVAGHELRLSASVGVAVRRARDSPESLFRDADGAGQCSPEPSRPGWARKVFVNLSPRQLLDPGLCSRTERYLRSMNVAASALAFEVTETVVVENFDQASEQLSRLRHIGCAVGLDDFGTGYSSLGYLRRLPVDFLKVDATLVGDLGAGPQALRIVETVVSLAKALSRGTIAEGIERQSQADALVAMGCDCGQGWLYGRPAPGTEGPPAGLINH
ncbi:MAG TPA: EAL domain-containing protein [Acidimicrobiales bacterium]|nr:EAL domain-containing protein [Acidimicrobiales bacterium]